MTRRVHLWGPPPDGKKGLQKTLCGRPVNWPTRLPLFVVTDLNVPMPTALEACRACHRHRRSLLDDFAILAACRADKAVAAHVRRRVAQAVEHHSKSTAPRGPTPAG